MPETTQDAEPYILFDLAGTIYGVKSREVLHMEMIEQITPVPNAKPFVEGVVLSRGQVIPALNLRVRFGFPRVPHTLRSRLLVVQAGERAVGLIVDSARDFRTIPQNVIQPPDAAIAGTTGKFLSGIASLGDQLTLLLDLKSTLNLLEAESNPLGAEAAIA
ncbi:MAG: chemotaxis protein CheW [Limisphaerales bacterium]